FIALASTFFLVFPIKRLAIKWNVVDVPGKRKIHKHITPGMGGLAISLGAASRMVYLQPEHVKLMAISLGACSIIVTGLLDARYNIRPIVQLRGQLSAAALLVFSGLVIE